jgi:putative glycosyltransferase (TIGR04372 family)
MPAAKPVARQFGKVRRATSKIAARRPDSGFFGFILRPIYWIGGLALSVGRALGLGHLFRLLKRLAVWAATGAMRLAYRHRRGVKSRAATLSDALERLERSRLAGSVPTIGAILFEFHVPILASMILAGVRQSLVVIAGAHLAAGQIPRALATVRVMNLLFRSYVKSGRRPVSHLYFEVLYRAHLLDRISRETVDMAEPDDFLLNRIFGISHLYRLDPTTARRFLLRAIDIHSQSYLEHRLLGRTYLVEGKYDEAARAFRRSVAILPRTVMGHQNYAGRYDIASYRPKAWELKEAGQLLIYDDLCQFAEDLFLRGNLSASLSLYQNMLRFQQTLAKDRQLPRKVRFPLWLEFDHFDNDAPVRLLSYEWVTQFGHIGLFDSVLKMIRLGMLPRANYVVLAPPDKVVNDDYLSYWEKDFCIVRDSALVDELFPYQRIFGENFMAFPAQGELAEPWTRAAARAQYAWAAGGYGPLIELSEEDRQFGSDLLEELGIEKGAWYVAFHSREGGYYAETAGGMSSHRNARIEDYFPAFEEITSRGGYVVRLGDASMRPLPPMPRVIDYARSPLKSSRMDLFLLATSRFVVGTTSGLTTVALSFGTPMLLVNCISNDWQLWTDTADFMVKKIYDRHQRRYLSLAETFRPPLQGYLINNLVLERHGYYAEPNSPEEILAAVRYKLDVVTGEQPRADDSHPLVKKYREALAANPFMFGAARPVLPFLASNPDLLIPPSECPPQREGAFPATQWDDLDVIPGVSARLAPRDDHVLAGPLAN